MTAVQNLPQPQQQQSRAAAQDQWAGQAGDAQRIRQAEQQARQGREADDANQSADSDKTFTVSTDDWF